MNVERLLNMVIRRVMQRVVFRGVDAGIDAMARKGKGAGAQADAPPSPEITRAQKENTRKAKRAARMSARMTKF
ncbi:hypothetical protein Q5Y75_02275 [Ruegeria sp. 2205SS24-7]|uniref:hypothetical protein n=1 Tax=Ruegeria discodermiae TaxID=3064389 RepID=UPI0027422BEE|nr:hypothetical protein [Ruegeria sp. 2205SS24-7]MDP5216035.1 hypothetical protein [Ruegeria sp. 2205SS24-7]